MKMVCKNSRFRLGTRTQEGGAAIPGSCIGCRLEVSPVHDWSADLSALQEEWMRGSAPCKLHCGSAPGENV